MSKKIELLTVVYTSVAKSEYRDTSDQSLPGQRVLPDMYPCNHGDFAPVFVQLWLFPLLDPLIQMKNAYEV